MKHDIVVIMSIEAPSYDEAVEQAELWVATHREGNALEIWPEGTEDVYVETYFEHDGSEENQRVLYLPNENQEEDPLDIEVSFEEDDPSYDGLPD